MIAVPRAARYGCFPFSREMTPSVYHQAYCIWILSHETPCISPHCSRDGKEEAEQEHQEIPEMPGSDYGFDRPTAIMAAPDFNDNLRTANIIACAYGEMLNKDLDTVVPVLSLIGTKADYLIKAFTQFKAWMDATGPDALRVKFSMQAKVIILASGLIFIMRYGG